MEQPKKAIQWIKENAKVAEDEEESLAEAITLIERALPELPEGSTHFAAVHLYLTKEGSVGFTYSKDARIEDRTLVCSLLETAEAILAKKGENDA